jgi:hypothetical protein
VQIAVLVAWAMGLFYAAGGVVHMRALALHGMVDDLLAMVGDKDAARERLRTRIMTAGALLTFASGVSLLVLSRWTLVILACNAVLQGAYLLWARRAFPPQDADEARGRRSTIRAFVLYLVAVAIVVLLDREGIWRAWMEPAVAELVVIAGLAGATLWIVRRPSRPAREMAAPLPGPGTVADAPADPRPPPQVLRLMPEYHCSPLWDDASGSMVDPDGLGLGEALVARIRAWDAAFQGTYRDDDLQGSDFAAVEIERAWVREGEAIAAELARAWQGGLAVRISGLGALLADARTGLGPWDETPAESARWIGELCRLAEIEDAIRRLDVLARERDALPTWDGDSSDDVAAAQVVLRRVLACVPRRYVAEVARGLDSAEAGTRAYVALALAEHDRDAALPFLRRALAGEAAAEVRHVLGLAVARLEYAGRAT